MPEKDKKTDILDEVQYNRSNLALDDQRDCCANESNNVRGGPSVGYKVKPSRMLLSYQLHYTMICAEKR